jgi:hypothetical protein
MNDCLNGATHGPVHILIGGAWQDTGDNIYTNSNLTSLQAPARVLYFKILWRTGYTRCPDADSCAADESSSCKCAVPDEYIEEFGAEGILKNSKIWYGFESELESADSATILEFLRALEDPGTAGEMFSSAACTYTHTATSF